MPELIDAVQYANYHYYSLPMTQLNLRVAQAPFPFKPLKLHTADHEHEFHVRSSHGLLHALAVMELIETIDETYLSHSVPGYQDALDSIQGKFKIDKTRLIEYIKVAALFHDGARRGDGIDVWDAESALNCKVYLQNEYQVDPVLAELLADVVELKDNSKAFKQKYQANWGDNIDFIRQLLNMADTLEVIRTRHVFKPEYLPIAAHVTPEVMATKIIPDLVVPHRQKIIDEGRLSRTGRIEYDVKGHHFDDGAYQTKPGYDLAKMTETYAAKGEQYKTLVLNINEDNIEEVLSKALRGVQTYINNYKNNSGVQLFHNGFFSPRYHGSTGAARAQLREDHLKSPDLETRVDALHQLLSGSEGPTLKEAVLHSFDQYNIKTICSDLQKYMDATFNREAPTSPDI